MRNSKLLHTQARIAECLLTAVEYPTMLHIHHMMKSVFSWHLSITTWDELHIYDFGRRKVARPATPLSLP
jgi:hypothetical protein